MSLQKEYLYSASKRLLLLEAARQAFINNPQKALDELKALGNEVGQTEVWCTFLMDLAVLIGRSLLECTVPLTGKTK